MAARRNKGLRARKRQKMRTDIYATARRLFIERGVGQTTVDDIADELEISPVTFFNYFRSKDAVLVEMAFEMLDCFDKTLEPPPGRRRMGLKRFVQIMGDRFVDAPGYPPHVIADVLRVSLFGSDAARLSERFRGILLRVAEQGQASGTIRTDLPPERVARVAAHLLIGELLDWLGDPRRDSDSRLREVLGRITEFARVRP